MLKLENSDKEELEQLLGKLGEHWKNCISKKLQYFSAILLTYGYSSLTYQSSWTSDGKCWL